MTMSDNELTSAEPPMTAELTLAEREWADAQTDATIIIWALKHADRLLSLARAGLEAGKAEESMREQIERVASEEGDGGAACGWRPCTGCHETEDGYSVGHYPHSPVFGCEVGSGCSECGGLGVVWEYYSKTSLDTMAKDVTATPSERFAARIGEGPRLAKAAGVYVGITVYDQDPAAIRALPLTGGDKP